MRPVLNTSTLNVKGKDEKDSLFGRSRTGIYGSSEDLINKNKQYNPLLSLADDRLTPDDQGISLCYTIVK